MPLDPTTMNTETIQYRLNLSNVLHAISPALAALHTTRAAALHPELSPILHPTHCPKCGTYRFSGDHPACPPTGKKRKRTTSSRSKSLQLKCYLCGFSVDATACTSLSPVTVQLPSDSSRTANVLPTSEIGHVSPSTDTLRPIAATVPVTASAPAPGRQSHSKSSHAKTSTLRAMLSRDRQREEGMRAQKKKKEAHEGLAAFLKEL